MESCINHIFLALFVKNIYNIYYNIIFFVYLLYILWLSKGIKLHCYEKADGKDGV